MRVVFHAINGVGLGHVVRASSLAVEMRALVPGIELLVITNAADVSTLDAAGLDFVQLPPRCSEPHADPRRSSAALPELVEEATILAAITAFGADLVVFDTHAPRRVVAQLPALGARAVLVLRELRAEALRAFITKGHGPIDFDRIVVPHDPSEVDVRELAERAPTMVVGPVVRALPSAVVPRPATSPLVVAIAGGGGQPVDARRYVRAVADAHLLARARIPTLETTLVIGPYGVSPAHVDRYPGLSVVQAPVDLAARLAAATLVVSQAGYNAVAELRSLEKPVIFVPGHRKAEDQRLRARRLVREGAAVIARAEARSIADRLEALLLDAAALDAMRAAHRARPIVPRNREAARAVLRPALRVASPVEKVAIVAHDFAPKLGGMETVARSLATGLAASGVEVRVYTTNRLGARPAGARGAAVEAIYRALPPPLRIDLETDLLATIDLALRDAPDVVHLCNAGLGPWVPFLRAALPCIVSVNVHGNDLVAPWVHHGMASSEAYRGAQIDGLSAADAVVCVSSFSRGLAAAAGVDDARLHVVENGVDPARFARAAPRAQLRERLGLREDDEILLTVSRLAPRKGHRTVLRALAALGARRPRLKFVFTGAGDAMRGELMGLAGELGVASRTVPVGFVADDDLPALYAAADVFVLLVDGGAADVEGFGVALLEAAAAGLPIVATRTGGIPEAVADGVTGILVAPGDALGAADAIARLFEDRPLASRLGEDGRRRVVERFAETATARRVLAIWNAVASAEARTPQPGGVALVRSAQKRAAAAREERAIRRAALARAIDRDRVVRLRATGEGTRLLSDALDDCASLGHAPAVEVKLRRFLDLDFPAHALPRVSAVDLVHGVPHASPSGIMGALEALPRGSFGRVKTLRLYLTPDARRQPTLAVGAVPEAHALRRFFSQRGVTVVPPPELMRYLSELPAGAPETGMIEPTNLCNLACPTCPTGSGKIAPLPQMTLARFDRVLEELAPAAKGRLRNLALWNYGEPLLNRELPRMIEHAKKAGVGVVKVSSNVHFLDGDRGRALLGSGLDVLILSVDGASQATYETFRKDGSFETVARSVAWLCAEKKRLGLTRPRIELQFIAMRHNEHELPEMRRLAAAWGVDKLRVKTVGADDDATRSLVPVSRLLSRYAADRATPNVRHAFCTMAWDHTVVNVDGSVTPCCYLRPDMGEAFVMGNVFETPFASIWRGEKYRAFRASMLGGRADMPVCGRCRGGTHDLIAAVEEVASPVDGAPRNAAEAAP